MQAKGIGLMIHQIICNATFQSSQRLGCRRSKVYKGCTQTRPGARIRLADVELDAHEEVGVEQPRVRALIDTCMKTSLSRVAHVLVSITYTLRSHAIHSKSNHLNVAVHTNQSHSHHTSRKRAYHKSSIINRNNRLVVVVALLQSLRSVS
jgi:hypothetical protein